MPRQAREVFEGLPYHIVQRGNFRMNIIDDPEDKWFYLKHLHSYGNQFKVKLYSWCLMDNHVHLIMEATDKTYYHQLFKHLNVKHSH